MTQRAENKQQQSIFLSAEVYRRAAKGDNGAIALLELWGLEREKEIGIFELELQKETIDEINRIFPLPLG